LLFILFLCFFTKVNAQFGIGTKEPNLSAQLDVVSSNRGVLITRVELKSLTDASTITNGNVEGLLVYNTLDNSSIQPGFYYWYSGSWRRILSEEVAEGTVVFYDVNNKTIYYIDDEGQKVIISNDEAQTIFTGEGGPTDLTVTGMKEGDLYVDIVGGKLYTYTKGNIWNEISTDIGRNLDEEDADLDLDEIFKKYESVSTLENKGNGNYTYTDEKGKSTDVEVLGDVINIFGEVIADDSVRKILIDFIKNDATENLTYDGTMVYYVNSEGERKELDFADIVKSNETISTLTKDGSQSIYTYTDESKKELIIDIKQDVINEFGNILNDESVINYIQNYLKVNQSSRLLGGDGIIVTGNGLENTPYRISRINTSPQLLFSQMEDNFLFSGSNTSNGMNTTQITSFYPPIINTVGSSWSSESGTFTVNRPGFYSIEASLIFAPDQWSVDSYAELNIVVGENIVASSIAYPNPVDPNAPQNIVISPAFALVNLGANDTIRLEVVLKGTGNKRIASSRKINFLKIMEIR
jgi:hypothetical protein